MSRTLDSLIAKPTAAQLRAKLLRELQGVGFTRQVAFSPGSLYLSGAPNAAYSVRVQIIGEGELGVATFRWSTDGGTTYSSTLVVPSSGLYVLPGTGLTLSFATGPAGAGASFLTGETFAIETRVPTLPVTSWQAGSTPLSLVENDAAVLEDIYSLISAIAAGGFVSTAVGPWLDLVAREVYDLKRNPAVTTKGYVIINNPTTARYIVSPGDIWFRSASGLRFQSQGYCEITPNTSQCVLEVRAEQPGAAYNVAANTINALVTSMPGCTVTNLGNWLDTQGANAETDQALALRCTQRWPALAGKGLAGAGAPSDAWSLWARLADPSITRVKVRTSTTVAGRVEVYLAGSSGPAGPAAVAAANAYIQPRVPLCSTALVQAAESYPYTVAATVYVRSGYQAQAAINCAKNLDALNTASDIGGTIYLSAVIDALQNVAGARNVVVTSPAADIAMASVQVGVLTQALTFVLV